jgi:hypothetical protein
MARNFLHILLGTMPLAFFAGPALGGDKKPSLEAAWQDLAGDDQARVTRAALILGRSPDAAVDFLKRNLRPVKADPALLKRWFAELDSEDSAVRATAQDELDYQGKFIKEDLKKAKDAADSAEVRRRLGQLLDKIEAAEKAAKQPEKGPGFIGKGGRSISVSNVNGQLQIIVDGVPLDLTPRIVLPTGPPKQWMRAVRAIGVLEALDSPAARQLLQAIAAGESDALPTVQARAALERIGKK